MIKSKIFTEKQDIDKVIEGLKANAQIVAKTFGYSGHDIGIRFDDHTVYTNDGVFVSNHIFFDDPLMDMGSDMIRKSTANADLISNDGTTATAILVNSIITKLQEKMAEEKDIDNNKVREGMELTKKFIIELLKETKKDINVENRDDLYNVAFTATRDEYLSNLLTDVFLTIGKDGKAVFKEFEGNKPEVEYQEGFNLPYGYNTPLFPNIFKDKTSIIIYNERINSIEVFQKIFTVLVKNQIKNVCFFVKDGVADMIMQQVYEVQQKTQFSNLNIIKIQGSETKVEKELKDLSIVTGATIIDNTQINIDTLSDCFGLADEIRITDKETIIIGGKYKINDYKKHLDDIQKNYDENRNDREKEIIQKRIANLKGKVAIIKIGGLSRERIDNYKDKIRDAIGSMKNAIENGTLPGGGIALFRLNNRLNNDIISNNNNENNKSLNLGIEIIKDALSSPLKQILINSNKIELFSELESNLEKLGNDCYYGFDARTNEIIEDVRTVGIVDPYNTIINSLSNAIDICELFLNLDGIIVVKSEVMGND